MNLLAATVAIMLFVSPADVSKSGPALRCGSLDIHSKELGPYAMKKLDFKLLSENGLTESCKNFIDFLQMDTGNLDTLPQNPCECLATAARITLKDRPTADHPRYEAEQLISLFIYTADISDPVQVDLLARIYDCADGAAIEEWMPRYLIRSMILREPQMISMVLTKIDEYSRFVCEYEGPGRPIWQVCERQMGEVEMARIKGSKDCATEWKNAYRRLYFECGL